MAKMQRDLEVMNEVNMYGIINILAQINDW